MIHVQMTPVPLLLPLPTKDKPEPSSQLSVFIENESDTFCSWAAIEKSRIVADFMQGFEHTFFLLRNKSDDENLLKQYYEFRSELSSDIVMGDVGCTKSNQCFANRCQWKVGEKSWKGYVLSSLLISLALLLLSLALATLIVTTLPISK